MSSLLPGIQRGRSQAMLLLHLVLQMGHQGAAVGPSILPKGYWSLHSELQKKKTTNSELRSDYKSTDTCSRVSCLHSPRAGANLSSSTTLVEQPPC